MLHISDFEILEVRVYVSLYREKTNMHPGKMFAHLKSKLLS